MTGARCGQSLTMPRLLQVAEADAEAEVEVQVDADVAEAEDAGDVEDVQVAALHKAP